MVLGKGFVRCCFIIYLPLAPVYGGQDEGVGEEGEYGEGGEDTQLPGKIEVYIDTCVKKNIFIQMDGDQLIH